MKTCRTGRIDFLLRSSFISDLYFLQFFIVEEEEKINCGERKQRKEIRKRDEYNSRKYYSKEGTLLDRYKTHGWEKLNVQSSLGLVARNIHVIYCAIPSAFKHTANRIKVPSNHD